MSTQSRPPCGPQHFMYWLLTPLSPTIENMYTPKKKGTEKKKRASTLCLLPNFSEFDYMFFFFGGSFVCQCGVLWGLWAVAHTHTHTPQHSPQHIPTQVHTHPHGYTTACMTDCLTMTDRLTAWWLCGSSQAARVQLLDVRLRFRVVGKVPVAAARLAGTPLRGIDFEQTTQKV